MQESVNNQLDFVAEVNRAVAAVSDQVIRIEELDALPIALLQTEMGTAT